MWRDYRYLKKKTNTYREHNCSRHIFQNVNIKYLFNQIIHINYDTRYLLDNIVPEIKKTFMIETIINKCTVQFPNNTFVCLFFLL